MISLRFSGDIFSRIDNMYPRKGKGSQWQNLIYKTNGQYIISTKKDSMKWGIRFVRILSGLVNARYRPFPSLPYNQTRKWPPGRNAPKESEGSKAITCVAPDSSNILTILPVPLPISATLQFLSCSGFMNGERMSENNSRDP